MIAHGAISTVPGVDRADVLVMDLAAVVLQRRASGSGHSALPFLTTASEG